MTPVIHTPSSRVQLVSNCPLFSGLQAEALSLLISQGKLLQTQGGEVIINQGAQSEGLYVILYGVLQVVINGDFEVAKLTPGKFFGEVSLFSLTTGASATIRSKTDAECLIIDRPLLKTLFTTFPQTELNFYKKLSSELCSRLASLNTRVKSD